MTFKIVRLANLLCMVFIVVQAQAGCITGNCIHGSGTFKYDNNSKYSGYFYAGKPHGSGILYEADGGVYTGHFHQGMKQGIGKLAFSNGNVYTGNFIKGHFQGKGRMTYVNGDVYLGEWNQDNATGTGKYTFVDGSEYEGHFENGYFSGQGKFTDVDGNYYDGTWFKNMKNGSGIRYINGHTMIVEYKNNQLVSEKQVDDDNKMNDNSTIVMSNQSNKNEAAKLKNCNTEYCDQTKGTYIYQDGSVYTGDFIQGDGEGMGQCVYANKDNYVGQWKNNAPHGLGTMTFNNGSALTAIWNNGVAEKNKQDATKKDTKLTINGKNKSSKSANMPKIYALIVGIATYQSMPSLKYTDDDAYLLYAFLKSPEGGALPDNQIRILVDEAATKKAIMNTLKDMASSAGSEDVLLIYMAGHGLEGSFVPEDFDGYKNQLAYTDIMSVLNQSSAKHKLFVADACHSGSMASQSRAPFDTALAQYYNALNTASGGTAVMMSSAKKEVSMEYNGLRQGVFSHFLIKGLKGAADKNGDDLVTLSELFDFVSYSVKDYTAKSQNPIIMGNYDKNMPVAWVNPNSL